MKLQILQTKSKLPWYSDGWLMMSVSEEFIGLYVVDNIQALTLKAVIKDTLLRMNLSFKRIRRECYDGASTMAGCS